VRAIASNAPVRTISFLGLHGPVWM
jgi:hypothetical protein